MSSILRLKNYGILLFIILCSPMMKASEDGAIPWDPIIIPGPVDYPTFGWINISYLPWIYCYEFPHWLYAANPGESAGWFYRKELGWFWHHSGYGGWVYGSFYGTGRYDRYDDLVRAYGGEVVPLCDYGCTVPPSDAISVTGIVLSEGTLELSVQYSGGCEEHDFYAFAEYWIKESNPPMVTLHLVHNGHGDTCEANVSDSLSFDLSEMLAIWGLDSDDVFVLEVNEAQLVVGE